MRIAISPDENPGDTGSVAADGTTERSVNLRVAGALQAALRRCGQDAWFDPTITYVERAAQASADGTKLLVACAHNESTPGRSGTQFVFCPGGEASGRQAAAADAVYAQLARIPGWPARLPNVDEAIVEGCDFSGDTVYAELLFMSDVDRALWSRADYGPVVAEAMARGLSITYGFPYMPPKTRPPEDNAMSVTIEPTAADAFAAGFYQGKPGAYAARDVYVALAADESVNGPLGAVDLTVYFVANDFDASHQVDPVQVKLLGSQQVTVMSPLQGQQFVRVAHTAGGTYFGRVYEELLQA